MGTVIGLGPAGLPGVESVHGDPSQRRCAVARGLGLSNSLEWDAWAKSDARPADVPSAADQAYRSDGWAGWGDFLGTGNIRPKDRSWRSFEESRALARTLDLVGGDGWADWCKTAERPDDVPVDPATVYKDEGWAGWADFLGTGRVHWRRGFI